MNKIAVNTIAKLVFTPCHLDKYYKLKVRKNELLKKKFHLFPYPHIEKIFAKENMFDNDWDLTMNLMGKEQLETYDSDIKVVDDKVYYKPTVVIVFLDKSIKTIKFDTNEEAIAKYNEFKEKFNLKDL